MSSLEKVVPKSKLSEWKGLDRIAPTVHGMKCIWREQEKDDIGVDGEIELCRPRQSGDGMAGTGKIIKVQSKSGMSYVVKDGPDSFASPVSEKDLRYWQDLNLPVLYVVYHPADDVLYWKDVKAYLAETPDAFEPPLRIEFDKEADRFDESSYDALLDLCEIAPERVALDIVETLYTNVLEVVRLPERVFVAPVLPEKQSRFHKRLTGRIPPYRYNGGTLITLTDPTRGDHALVSVVDGAAEEIALDDWLTQDPEADYGLRGLLNSLVHRRLRHIGLAFQKRPRRYFFNEGLSVDSPLRRTWTNSRTNRTPTRQVAKYYEYAGNRFYKHLAVDVRADRFGDRWAFAVNPKLHYSTDGTRRWEGEVARSYAIRARAREFNNTYLNNILFWSHQLSGGEPTFELNVYGEVVAEVSGVPLTATAGFGVRPSPPDR